jgi:arginase
MKIQIIAAPFDSGYYQKRLGVGASQLSSSSKEFLEAKGHHVKLVTLADTDNPFPTEVTTSFEVSRKLSALVREAKADNALPIIFSGNCNTATGTLGGLRKEGIGVIWFDCHGDFNTPDTTVGGFFDGTALAIVAGKCWKNLANAVDGFKPIQEDKMVLIGARDFDTDELRNLSASQVRIITPEMIHSNAENIGERYPEVDSVYLHIDLDVIDTSFLKVNTYATSGGLMPEHLYDIVKQIRNKYEISAIAFTAYDPSLDPGKKIEPVINQLLSLLV